MVEFQHKILQFFLVPTNLFSELGVAGALPSIWWTLGCPWTTRRR